MIAMKAMPSPVRISPDSQQKLHSVADELEQIAEEIRARSQCGRVWGGLQPQWQRLRQLESGLRWMIES